MLALCIACDLMATDPLLVRTATLCSGILLPNRILHRDPIPMSGYVLLLSLTDLRALPSHVLISTTTLLFSVPTCHGVCTREFVHHVDELWSGTGGHACPGGTGGNGTALPCPAGMFASVGAALCASTLPGYHCPNVAQITCQTLCTCPRLQLSRCQSYPSIVAVVDNHN